MCGKRTNEMSLRRVLSKALWYQCLAGSRTQYGWLYHIAHTFYLRSLSQTNKINWCHLQRSCNNELLSIKAVSRTNSAYSGLFRVGH